MEKSTLSKKRYYLGMTFSVALLLVVLLLNNKINSMIISWFAGPITLLPLISWFKSDITINIISSVLFITYYSLCFSSMLKYYFLNKKITAIFIFSALIIINTISIIISMKYLLPF